MHSQFMDGDLKQPHITAIYCDKCYAMLWLSTGHEKKYRRRHLFQTFLPPILAYLQGDKFPEAITLKLKPREWAGIKG